VRRYYDSKPYRRRFAKKLWQHRWSLWHVVRHLPQIIQAARYFSAGKAELEAATHRFAPHPRQPRGLSPFLSPELQADAIASMSPVKVSRKPKPPLPRTGGRIIEIVQSA
jgi:magnesium-protoporphyrin IX monomethyl ester (oxidative) cyclase